MLFRVFASTNGFMTRWKGFYWGQELARAAHVGNTSQARQTRSSSAADCNLRRLNIQTCVGVTSVIGRPKARAASCDSTRASSEGGTLSWQFPGQLSFPIREPVFPGSLLFSLREAHGMTSACHLMAISPQAASHSCTGALWLWDSSAGYLGIKLTQQNAQTSAFGSDKLPKWSITALGSRGCRWGSQSFAPVHFLLKNEIKAPL